MIARAVAKFVHRWPMGFDLLKKCSRAVGFRTPLYDRLLRYKQRFPDARVLQIGANDGQVNDPLREHILSSRWQCLLVEPVPFLFERLKKAYAGLDRVECLNAAVSDMVGCGMFYFVREDVLPRLPYWASQLGSFSIDHIRKHFTNIDESWITAAQVEIVDLRSLLGNKGPNFDLVHMDVEGHEAFLLDALLQSAQRPTLILFETAHMGSEADTLMRRLNDAGYAIEQHGMDSLAVRRGASLYS